MSHRAFITGISGFAGGFLAAHLRECGDAVLGAAVDGQWEPHSDAAVAERTPLAAWDLSRAAGLSDKSRRQIMDFQPDCIYHLAAVSVPSACGAERPTPQAQAINVDGTRRVLELAAALSPRPRVIAVSSSHVYAPVTAATACVAETAPVGPGGGYGQTKLAAEQAVAEAVARGQVDAVIVRPFQHAGPRQNPPMMLPQWIAQVVAPAAGPITLHTRDAFIDVSDVRDVVRAYRLLAEQGQCGAIYNVGSGVCRRSGDVLATLLRIAGCTRPIHESRPGVKYDPIADTTRLEQLTGWRPLIPLETTVADALASWPSRC